MEVGLNIEQVIMIGFIATILTSLIRFILTRFQHVKIDKTIITIVVAILSVFLAIAWNMPALSIFDPENPLVFVETILNQAITVVGMATLIYNLLIVKVLEKLTPNIFDVS